MLHLADGSEKTKTASSLAEHTADPITSSEQMDRWKRNERRTLKVWPLQFFKPHFTIRGADRTSVELNRRLENFDRVRTFSSLDQLIKSFKAPAVASKSQKVLGNRCCLESQ